MSGGRHGQSSKPEGLGVEVVGVVKEVTGGRQARSAEEARRVVIGGGDEGSGWRVAGTVARAGPKG